MSDLAQKITALTSPEAAKTLWTELEQSTEVVDLIASLMAKVIMHQMIVQKSNHLDAGSVSGARFVQKHLQNVVTGFQVTLLNFPSEIHDLVDAYNLKQIELDDMHLHLKLEL